MEEGEVIHADNYNVDGGDRMVQLQVFERQRSTSSQSICGGPLG